MREETPVIPRAKPEGSHIFRKRLHKAGDSSSAHSRLLGMTDGGASDIMASP